MLHLLLFLLTVFTVFLSTRPYNPLAIFSADSAVDAFAFVCSVMAILLAHELGHYLAGILHGVEVTLPYFIPIPFGFGTMGAVIRMKQIRHRRQLLDVGVAGPLAGMALAAPLAVAGIALSHVGPIPGGPSLMLGDSLLFKSLVYLIHGSIPAGQDVYLHPIALAAWFGFLVTSLNLMPASQLDGGHIIKALYDKLHGRISRLVFIALTLWGAIGDAVLVSPYLAATGGLYLVAAFLAVFTDRLGTRGKKILALIFILHVALSVYLDLETVSLPWLVWPFLLYIFRLDHPPVADPEVPLSFARRAAGWLSIVIFLLTFIPLPVTIITH